MKHTLYYPSLEKLDGLNQRNDWKSAHPQSGMLSSISPSSLFNKLGRKPKSLSWNFFPKPNCASDLGIIYLTIIILIYVGCSSEYKKWEPPDRLSVFGLFLDNGTMQVPAAGVVPYEINTPLFSDYSEKYRFIKLPEGQTGTYNENLTFDLPVGTVLAKTFAYPNDFRDPSKGRRLLETRLLVHRPNGWIGLPYVWNDEQNEAMLEISGDWVNTEWIHSDGQKIRIRYMVPNMNQCKQCHDQNDQLKPIGIRARQLNREYNYLHGSENQLNYWSRQGMIKGAPDATQAPRFPVWNDPKTGSLNERARAWLEVNCAHCHSPKGRSWSTGLDLMANQRDPSLIGVYKVPTAAGRGTGGHEYDIVPGKPDASIFVYRIGSVEPDIAMPELGRRLVHKEGLALVKKWIKEMKQ